MKQEENIHRLANQYFEGRISRADEKIMFEYIEQAQEGYATFRNWEREWMSNSNSDKQIDKEWESLQRKMVTQEAIIPLLKNPKFNVWKIARIAAIIVLIIGSAFGFRHFDYLLSSETYFVCEAPLGDKSKIQLSDGTIVWLNAGSVLKYSNRFNMSNRIVELDGEGYFEVTKQNGKTFMVKTRGYDVTVKGTKFNISAYPDDSFIVTTLLEGAVELNYKDKKVEMYPGESLALNLKTELLINRNVNAQQAMSWTEDRIEFDDITLKEMVKKLSRQYDVHIELESEKVGNMKFRVSLRNKETIIEVMNALKEIIPISVEYKEKDIYIR